MKIIAPAKNTKNCFKDFYYRDLDLDAWLPENQPKISGEITVIQLTEELTFLEMAKKYLGSTGTEVIKKHTLTLPMVEEMVTKHKDELKTDGYANFFFTEDKDGSVSVGFVHRCDRVWNAHVSRLDNDHRWYAGYRFLVRNLDASKLGNSDTSAITSLEACIKELE
jgi:hypothetical protein